MLRGLRNKSTFVVRIPFIHKRFLLCKQRKNVLRLETSVFKRVGEMHNILISQNNQAVLWFPQHGGNLLQSVRNISLRTCHRTISAPA